MALVPCDSCRRHVRAGETACPFCKAVRNATTVAAVAVSALAIAGCDAVSPASKYGGPPPDYPAAAPSTDASDAASPRLSESPDASAPKAPVAIYGAPPRR